MEKESSFAPKSPEAEKEPRLIIWRCVLDVGMEGPGIVQEIIATTEDEARQKAEEAFGMTDQQKEGGGKVHVEEMVFEGYDLKIIPKE